MPYQRYSNSSESSLERDTTANNTAENSALEYELDTIDLGPLTTYSQGDFEATTTNAKREIVEEKPAFEATPVERIDETILRLAEGLLKGKKLEGKQTLILEAQDELLERITQEIIEKSESPELREHAEKIQKSSRKKVQIKKDAPQADTIEEREALLATAA